MIALSIRQPWATYIIEGRKVIERRTWTTKYRGPLLICTGQQPDIEALKRFGFSPAEMDYKRFPHGQAIGVVDLIDVRPMTEQDVKFAHVPVIKKAMSWIFARPRKIEPFPVKGQLSLFEVQYQEPGQGDFQ